MGDEDKKIAALVDRCLAVASQGGYKEVVMSAEECEMVLDRVKPILLERPMLLEIEAPTKVLGDIHGQFYDLLALLEVIGVPNTKNQMLFLGDYVDRGKFGLETVMLLFSYKIQFPDHFHLLRGNHESKAVSRVYGFYEECKTRYSPAIWKRFIDVFDCLPVACIISKAIFCMHGGLSPNLTCMDDIRKLPRPSDVPPGGLMADLLWSDPDKKLKAGWAENPRGVSFIFAKNIVDDTCKKYNFDLIIRAHQVVYHGFELFADSKLITIFTAPNFCGQFENNGAIVSIDETLKLSMVFMDGSGKKGKKAKKKTNPGASSAASGEERSQMTSHEPASTMSATPTTEAGTPATADPTANPNQKKKASKKTNSRAAGAAPKKHTPMPPKK